MDAVKYLMVIIMVGMVAKALWSMALIGKSVWEHRDHKE